MLTIETTTMMTVPVTKVASGRVDEGVEKTILEAEIRIPTTVDPEIQLKMMKNQPTKKRQTNRKNRKKNRKWIWGRIIPMQLLLYRILARD